MSSKSCVYWIHLPKHTDMFTQGYVGVCKNGAEYRFKEHQSKARLGSSLPIHRAMRKYGEKLLVDTIINADIDYCYEMENKLRPSQRIGYNVDVGGNCNKLGSKHSEETKEKMRSSAVARGQRPSQLALDNSAKTNSKNVAWLCRFSDKNIWLDAERIYKHLLENPSHGIRKVGSSLGIAHSKLQTIHKKIKSGWNPLEDKEWLIFSSKLTPDASGDKSVQSAFCQN